jgi:hypothetical protein
MRTSMLKVLVAALVMMGAIAVARPALAGVQIGIHLGLPLPVVVAPVPAFVTVAPVVTPPVVYYVPPKPVFYRPVRHRPAWPPGHFKRSGAWGHGHWRR